MKLRIDGRIKVGTTEYPALSMAIALVLIMASLFLPVYLRYVAFAICLYRIFRYDAKVFATDYCVLMPFSSLFRAAGGVTLMVWLCLIAAIWYLVRGKLRVNGAFVLLILLLNYLLLRMQMNINDFVLCFGQMCVLFVLVPKQDAGSAERSVKAFIWSMLLAAGYAMLFRNDSHMLAVRGPEDAAIWGTSIMRFSGFEADPNYYATLILVGLALLCKLRETGRIRSLWFWVQGGILTLIGALTYSKSFLLVFVLLGGIYIIWQMWNRKVIKGMVWAALATVMGIYLLFAESSPFAVIMTRLTSSSGLEGFTTGRNVLFAQYWNVISENASTLLLGKGLQADILQDKGVHNIYLEIMYYTGAIGLVLMMAFYISMIRSIEQQNPALKKQGAIAKYTVILILAVLYLALQGMFQVITYAGLFLAFVSVYLTKEEKKPGQERG